MDNDSGDVSQGLSGAPSREDGELSSDVAGRQVVTIGQHTQTNLLLVALLDHLSSLYIKEPKQSKQLFHAIVDALIKQKVLTTLVGLDEVSSLRSEYKVIFSKLVQAAVASIHPKGFHTSNIHDRARVFLQPGLTVRQPRMGLNLLLSQHTSRYQDEFYQLERVGHGAYGSVFRVENKLDSCQYAVKKIPFQSSETDVWQKIIREVKLLAELNHKNVVRYHHAWLEFEHPVFQSLPETPGNTSPRALPAARQLHAITYASTSSKVSKIESRNTPGDVIDDLDDDDDSVVVFDRTEASHNTSHRAEAELVEATSSESVSPSDSSHSYQEERSSLASQDHVIYTEQPALQGAAVVVLHIQMELCSRTLKDWIDRRNAQPRLMADTYSVVDEVVNGKILRDILRGIRLIHKHGIIHRDIKPKNIFLVPTESDVCPAAKLGDFGLARHCVSGEEPLTPHAGRSPGFEGTRGEYTSGVGTTVYAAPEQLSETSYTEKCDLYSLGLVLFELYQPFSTTMERVDCLRNLGEKKILPEGFTQRWPKQGQVILQLMSNIPDSRPSAAELLNSELFHTKDQIISRQMQQISELRKCLKEKDAEIARLRQKLNKVT